MELDDRGALGVELDDWGALGVELDDWGAGGGATSRQWYQVSDVAESKGGTPASSSIVGCGSQGMPERGWCALAQARVSRVCRGASAATCCGRRGAALVQLPLAPRVNASATGWAEAGRRSTAKQAH